MLSGNAPVLGASGAIAAVAGAYLVLLPRTNITLLVWLFYLLLPVEVSSLYFIAFQFVFEIFMTAMGLAGPSSGGVAYAAHATGYLFGILVSALLLALRVMPRDDFDLLHLLEHYRKKRQFRRMVAEGYDPFNHPTTPPSSVRVDVETLKVEEPARAAELDMRRRISEAFASRDIPTATALYVKLLQVAPEAVLAKQQQLDVANQLMATEQYNQAGVAYERFVNHYPNYEYMPDIHLMLGLLYGRYVKQYDRAENFLEMAVEKLTDANKRNMAEQELAAVRKKLGK